MRRRKKQDTTLGTRTSWIIIAALALAAVVFIALKIYAITYIEADENLYFYFGKLISEGKSPYTEFRHSHPPLPIYIYGAICTIKCGHAALKPIAIIAALASALAIFLIARHQFGDPTAAISTTLFLFSRITLEFSSHNSGFELGIALLLLGIYAHERKNAPLTGTLFTLSVLCSLATLPIIIAYLAFSWILNMRSHKQHQRAVLWTAGTLIGAHLLLSVLYGKAFWEQTYLVWLKNAIATQAAPHLRILKSVLAKEWAHALLLLFALFYSLRTRTLYVYFGIIVVFLVEMLLLLKIYDHYFLLLMPFAALLIGYAAMQSRTFIRNTLIGITILLVASNAYLFTQDVRENYFNGFVPLRDWVRTHTQFDSTIFGDSSVTPLLALETKRAISAEQADMYDTLFLAGYASTQDAVIAVRGDSRLSYVILDSFSWMHREEHILEFVTKSCSAAEVFNVRGRPIAVLACRGTDTATAGPAEDRTPAYCSQPKSNLMLFHARIQDILRKGCQAHA